MVAERRDYCLAEVFEAECGSREVVMIQTARYGRMRIGRCVRSDIYTYCTLSCGRRIISQYVKKGKRSPYSITEGRVPELIPVLGSQPAGDASHKPGSRLPLLSARPAVTLRNP